MNLTLARKKMLSAVEHPEGVEYSLKEKVRPFQRKEKRVISRFGVIPNTNQANGG